MIRVGVLFGGRSSEREVSLASGRQVYHSLDRNRYQGVPIFMDTQGTLWHLPDKLVLQNTTSDIVGRVERDAQRLDYEALAALVDVVFIALHGKYGDDGCIQGVLELLDIPYTGSGVLACALSLDKPSAHRVLAAAGLASIREVVVAQAAWENDVAGAAQHVAQQVGFPCVVKPTREGSSVGVSVVQQADELAAAVERALAWDTAVLVEERLEGMEFSVIVIGNEEVETLVPTEIVTPNSYMTYDDKYMPGRSQKITPARADPATLERIGQEAARAHRALGFRGYSRIDGFVMADGRVIITDPNSTSGMSPSSFLFHQAAEAGLRPADIIGRILELAQETHAQKQGPL